MFVSSCFFFYSSWLALVLCSLNSTPCWMCMKVGACPMCIWRRVLHVNGACPAGFKCALLYTNSWVITRKTRHTSSSTVEWLPPDYCPLRAVKWAHAAERLFRLCMFFPWLTHPCAVCRVPPAWAGVSPRWASRPGEDLSEVYGFSGALRLAVPGLHGHAAARPALVLHWVVLGQEKVKASGSEDGLYIGILFTQES